MIMKIMKQIITVIAIALALFVLLVVVTRGQAASGGQFTLEKSALAGGGREKGAAATVENGTTGQAVAGHHSAGGQFSVLSGFWTPDVSIAPTAAPVIVSGRVMTADGRGIKNVRVTLTSSSGGTRTVVTATFGYYRFADVEPGTMYVMGVSAKRFTFAEPTRLLHVTENVADYNFTANL